MNSGVVQFPQPTRPIGSYNIRSPQNIHDSQSLQTPQPSEPITTYNMSNEDHMAMPQYFDHSQVPVAPPSTTAEEKDQHEGKIQEAVEEQCRGILEIYDRLPVSLQSQLNLDHIKAPTSFAKGLKTNSGAMRGCQQGSIEELRHKLERFKVKTIQLAEIVKEEQKRLCEPPQHGKVPCLKKNSRCQWQLLARQWQSMVELSDTWRWVT